MSIPSELRAGTVLTASRTLTESDIARCAKLTGDYGAHHTAGIEGRPIAQGLLTVAAAPLMRNDNGFHLLSVSLTFLAPVFADDRVTAEVRLIEVTPGVDGRLDVRLSLAVRNPDGVDVITGDGAGYFTEPDTL